MHPSHLEEQKQLWKDVVIALLPTNPTDHAFQTADYVVRQYEARYQQPDPFLKTEESQIKPTL